jgi:uncharacterized protein (TIGR02145 family)
MKKIKNSLMIALALVCSFVVLSQVPNKMSFQTVVRNSFGKLVINKSVGVRLSIIQPLSNGTALYYEEIHSKSTNTNGLVTLEIGTGTVTTGTFSTINWSQGSYFLKTEIDVNGGSNYTITGVTEFVSVPYAMNSKISEAVKTVANGANVGDMNYWNGTTWVPLSAGAEGQTLTFCGGKPTWTIGGVCPGTISTINCGSATNNGTLTATIAANGVTSVIYYTGGNGGSHNGQVVTSSGVTGLTATIQAGNFANGAGSATYTITGTPSISGTATFTLNIGGKTCTLTRTIDALQQSSGINFTSIGVPIGLFQANLTDIDGNIYKTVKIGTQFWMAENLKTTKYNDGTLVINVTTDNTQWVNNTTGAWSYYNNDVVNNAKYGKLYNWYSVSSTTNGNKNVCPTGWHVPTDAEWTVLADYLGGANIAGGKIKEVGTTDWISPNTDATNISLFTGLPGGARSGGGSFSSFASYGYMWSSTEGDMSTNAWARGISANNANLNSYFNSKRSGHSVRCLKD